jgi:hypothetical protein
MQLAMDLMKRYAVYFAPRAGDFAARAAEWLGRDPVSGQVLMQPEVLGIDAAAITEDCRRYGFHGTIRAPFRPAVGVEYDQISACLADLAARLAPVTCTGLRLENLNGFLALTPDGCDAALRSFAATVVEATNPLRAPLTKAEIVRRRPDCLSRRQHEYLDRWGYPYVMDEFRFHLTLTDRLTDPGPAMVALQAHFAPVLPRPFMIEDLCLFGEDRGGSFHLLHRHALAG